MKKKLSLKALKVNSFQTSDLKQIKGGKEQVPTASCPISDCTNTTFPDTKQ